MPNTGKQECRQEYKECISRENKKMQRYGMNWEKGKAGPGRARHDRAGVNGTQFISRL